MVPCPNCNGTGKIKIEKPTSNTTMDMVEEPCSFCEGTGQVFEDYTPQVIERLDKIIELLEKLIK